VRGRLLLLLVVVALWSAAIAARLAALQVEHHEEYRARARSQQRMVVELEPPRGTIFDARGRELAVSVEVDSAYANPRRLQAEERVEEAARRLAPLLGRDAAELAEALSVDREFVWLERQLDPPRAAAVAALELPGVGFLEEYKRYYPMGEVAAQVLGFAGIDQRGLEGLEHLYHDVVAGREGTQTLLRDARRGTAASPLLAGSAPRPGASLHLTLDAAIQHIAERELAAAVEREHAAGGSVVVLDPRTGAVLALASAPLIDANRFPEYPLEHRRNRPVVDAYEPGSTFKMVTAAAALSANLLDPTDELDCEMGGITLAGVRIRDHKRFGLLTFRDVIARSSNVGAIKTGLLLGDQRLYDAVRAFGFGRPTGIDLPAESAGELSGTESWRRWPLTKAYVSFGQGISVTPLQLARAFAAVANGGELLRPWVVAAVGEPRRPEPPPDRLPGAAVALAAEPSPARRAAGGREVVGRPLSAATARELERMLEAVVEEGTGRAAAVPGYPVAGKTGTAQKAKDGAYSPRHFVASFAGFVPARDPRLVIVVAVDEPWPSYHGGAVAAPVFARIAEQALIYLGVPPGHLPEALPGHGPEEAPETEVPPPAPPRSGIALASTAGMEEPPV
jgi:cell division protein FtsI (penicillin-binding protein 3)